MVSARGGNEKKEICRQYVNDDEVHTCVCNIKVTFPYMKKNWCLLQTFSVTRSRLYFLLLLLCPTTNRPIWFFTPFLELGIVIILFLSAHKKRESSG